MGKVQIDTGYNGVSYDNGTPKIFGMENFGNTCYCNSILQCLFYSDSFRNHLVNYKNIKRDPILEVHGVRPHTFTTKYEQLLEKKRREQSKERPLVSLALTDKSRKGSIFGLNFKSYSSTVVQPDEKKMANYISTAEQCQALSMEQRIKISKNPEFQKLSILVTRPSKKDNATSADRSSYSQSSSMLLLDSPEDEDTEGSVMSTSSAIIVGIPNPEPFLVQPINPFSLNPSSDQRKRSALINGPIINLDSGLTESNDDTVLLYALKDMFEGMIENKSTIGVVSPNYFITKLKEKNVLFRQNNMHHDAHEFFNYLLNEIIEVLDKDLGPENNWCNEIFQGMITNETKCLNCETVTSKHEYFLDLSVDVPPGESAYSLTHSLNNFSKPEVLTNQNKFYCNSCSSLQEAVKTIKLKKLPEVLVINFKRFKYDESVDSLVKLFDSISYPFKLRLFNTTNDESSFNLYELYGLVIHIGGGPTHGHYVALCKVKAGLWLLFDDETVELVEHSYVMRFFGNGPGMASAYILFYNKIKPTETEQDLGFTTDAFYNGNDYTIFEKLNSSDTTLKKGQKLDEQDPIASETSSIHSNGEMPAKKGLFKNFKFDSTNGNHNSNGNTNTTNTSISSNATIVNTTPSVAPNTDRNNVSNGKEKENKKTWVGGLMRRESSQINTPERKASTTSVGTSEKRKSIFGFKRKEKKDN
jgi:ubiquitin carboxyl-terminal hydrolase 9/13